MSASIGASMAGSAGVACGFESDSCSDANIAMLFVESKNGTVASSAVMTNTSSAVPDCLTPPFSVA